MSGWDEEVFYEFSMVMSSKPHQYYPPILIVLYGYVVDLGKNHFFTPLEPPMWMIDVIAVIVRVSNVVKDDTDSSRQMAPERRKMTRNEQEEFSPHGEVYSVNDGSTGLRTRNYHPYPSGHQSSLNIVYVLDQFVGNPDGSRCTGKRYEMYQPIAEPAWPGSKTQRNNVVRATESALNQY